RTPKASQQSADLLSLCAYLGPDDLPLTLLSQGVEHFPVPLAATVTNPVTLHSAIAILRRYALLELTSDTRDALSMHRLVKAGARDRLQEQGEHWTWIEIALGVVLGALTRSREAGWAWRPLARLLPHALAVARHVATLPMTLERAQQELRLLHILGETLILF